MKNKLFIIFLGIAFILFPLIFNKNDKIYKVKDVLTPVQIVLNTGEIKLDDIDCFDTEYTEKNGKLAKNLNITEDEAFILGNLGKYWAYGLLKGRFVYLNGDSDLIYLRTNYREKFKYSGYCLKDSKPCFQNGFEKVLTNIRKTKYAVLDLDSDIAYEIPSNEIKHLKRFIVIKKIHLPKHSLKKSVKTHKSLKPTVPIISTGKIKVFFSDSTNKLKPNRECTTSVCKEILNNIDNAKNTIDIAIYGYSRTPEIENALILAQNRGVKIRLVYDSDAVGKNIYPDTDIIKKILSDNKSDLHSAEANSIMHNKFYIFDNRILITGSANLSHTDMSDFNSNNMVVIESEEVAKIYKQEFEQMFSGKFHNEKIKNPHKSVNISGTNLDIYFSPKDKCTTTAIIPIINNAKNYIYIPTFVLTDKKVTEALILAKQRGVDVKIIIDALNASVQHSKHKDLRIGGILVKTENHAGKMHSKSMIIDDTYTIIGSMNFSYSGENKNDENLIIIKNADIAKAYKKFFLYQWSMIDNKWLKFNARAEGKDSVGSCSDGLDNNYDGFTDMEDSACKSL